MNNEKQSDEFVTIVSGLPRSGTSMMMRMLESGGIPAMTDGIRKADEDNPAGYYEFEVVKKTKESTDWLKQAPGRVVKMIYRLLYDLPDNYSYRVVFMRRNIDEILASQETMLKRQGQSESPIDDEKMAAMFRKEIAAINKWLVERPNFSLLEVNYNELLTEPGKYIETVDTFLGGNLDTKAMAGVVDHSLYRNRR